MKVKVAKYSPIPMNLYNRITDDGIGFGTIFEVIKRLTNYFTFVGLNVKISNSEKIFIRITIDSDINKLVDQSGNIISLDSLIYDTSKKSITVVDLYGAEIFKVKF